MTQAKATVFVVDDDPGVLRSLSRLIESLGLPVETHASARSFLESYDAARPGCLVLDMRMPGMSGTELQDRLHAAGAGIPIIIVTGHGDIPMAVSSIKNGAFDFIEKPYRAGVLINRIQAALRDDARLRDEQAAREDIEARLARLTPREREVLGLLTAGETVKQIAARLGLSHKTVQVHRAHIMEKTEAGSLADLIRYSMTLAEP